MLRRHFLKRLLASLVLPLSLSLATAQAAEGFIDYTPGLIKKELAAGKTLFVDYAASWCSTCARQERVINELRSESPAYQAITFIRVDWDKFASHEVTTSRNIPRRSTLLVLRGDEELGRIVAGTGKSEIKALLDVGLVQ